MLSLHHWPLIRDDLIKEPEWMKPFHVDWPIDRIGPWSIWKFTIDKYCLTNLRAMRIGRGAFPGDYTNLRHDTRGPIMSDTTAEIFDLREVYRRARGRLLVHGLGLGCFIQAVLSKPEVEHIDVVEIDADVIELIGKYFAGDNRVTIHHDNCLTKRWPSGSHWDVIWHDIWDTINKDNYEEMKTLTRKFARRCDWQGSWSRPEVEAMRRSSIRREKRCVL